MDYSKKVLMDNIYYLAKKNNITLGKLEELDNTEMYAGIEGVVV